MSDALESSSAMATAASAAFPEAAPPTEVSAEAIATAAAVEAMHSAVAAAEAASATLAAVVATPVFSSGGATEALDMQHHAVGHAPAEDETAGAGVKTRTRSTNLTHEQKRLICLYAKQNPTCTQAQLGKWAKDQFGLSCVPSQSSISHTLKRRHTFEHMKSEDWSSKRMRTVKYPDLDTALANWFLYCQARQVRIQGDEIKAKAQTFFDLMQLQTTSATGEPPQFSNGWLHSFQSRHGFSRSPNTHASDNELITCREELVDAVKGFAPWDVYWMDETKLSIALNPERFEGVDTDGGLTSATLAAAEKQITVAFCCNADGSELLDPFFICDGQLAAAAGESVSSETVEYGFTYAHNKKIWMTPTLFREWMLALDWKMHEENRQVMLLLDSFSSHQVKKMTLKNVVVRSVAQTPFGESYMDPVEHTVVGAVKRRYRQLYLESVVSRKDDQQPPVYDVDVMQAIQWVLKSWRGVPKTLVAEAFGQVGITSDDIAGLAAADGSTQQTEEKIEAQLMAALQKLKVKEPFRLSEFISPVNEKIVDEDFTDQDFVDCAMHSSLSAAVVGRNAEPPRKIARVSRVKKTFQPASSGAGLGAFAGRGLQARAGAAQRVGSADDLTTTVVPDEEWQAWADSQRYRIDEFHALETVIRLAADMNCEPTTLLDLTRMQAELLQKRQPDGRTSAIATAASEGTATGAAGENKPPAGGVCRFNFVGNSTTI